ncbi:MAG TPA: diadenylate cyclase CdaA [Chloroflexia bacterium]|nr:diadenylate cyclase CdaA [Chloroflexia bacterium]
MSWVLDRITWSTLLDVAAVALIFYWLLAVVQGTRAVQLVRGIIILWLASALLSTIFQLSTLTWLIRNSGLALLVAIPIIFQPELRRALEQLGRTGTWLNRGLLGTRASIEGMIEEVAAACALLARQKHGALIVMERQTGLQDYADKGVIIDAEVSRQMLATIFYPNSPMHDGAVILRNGRIVAAGAVLPLSDNVLGPVPYGTRHRAAIGISEYSDAIAVVVSEERGTISIAANGRLVSNLSADRLRKVLLEIFRVKRERRRRGATPPRPADVKRDA